MALVVQSGHGGQGLPKVVAAAVQEMWKSANMAFSLCPLLTTGAIEALELRGSDAQKAMYLPKMVSGKWTGTMNLTEPQAGSDLAAIRTRAEPQADGSYRDLRPEDLHHLRRARHGGEHRPSRAGAHCRMRREGVKGISLFVVPKFLVNADGTLGERNDCVLRVDRAQARHPRQPDLRDGLRRQRRRGRHLVGKENDGLEYMFS